MALTVRMGIHIRAPREFVFQHLLTPHHLARWFCNFAAFDPRGPAIGTKFRFGGDYAIVAADAPGWTAEILGGEVLKSVTFRWPLPDAETRVEWQVEDAAEGSVMRVVHSGPPPADGPPRRRPAADGLRGPHGPRAAARVGGYWGPRHRGAAGRWRLLARMARPGPDCGDGAAGPSRGLVPDGRSRTPRDVPARGEERGAERPVLLLRGLLSGGRGRRLPDAGTLDGPPRGPQEPHRGGRSRVHGTVREAARARVGRRLGAAGP